jgi:hypothetical protein
MDFIFIIVGLALLIGLSLGFCLGVLLMAFLGGSELDEVSRRPVFRHAVSGWWR